MASLPGTTKGVSTQGSQHVAAVDENPRVTKEAAKRWLTAADIKKEVVFLRPNVGKAVEDGPQLQYVGSCGRTFEEMLLLHGNKRITGTDPASMYLRRFLQFLQSNLDRRAGGHTNRKHVDSSNRQIWDRIQHHQHRNVSATTKFTNPGTAELAIACTFFENMRRIYEKLSDWLQRKNAAYEDYNRLQQQRNSNFAPWELDNVGRLAPQRRMQLQQLDAKIGKRWKDAQQDFSLHVRCDLRDLLVGFGYLGLFDKVNIRRSFNQVRLHLTIQKDYVEIMSCYPDDATIAQWEMCTSDSVLQRFGSMYNPVLMLIPVYFDMELYWGNLEAVARREGKGVVWSGWETLKTGAEAKRHLEIVERKKAENVKVTGPTVPLQKDSNVVETGPTPPGPASGGQVSEKKTVNVAPGPSSQPDANAKTAPTSGDADCIGEEQKTPQTLEKAAGPSDKGNNVKTTMVPADAVQGKQQDANATSTIKTLPEEEKNKTLVKKAEDLIQSICFEASNSVIEMLQVAANEIAGRIYLPGIVTDCSMQIQNAEGGESKEVPADSLPTTTDQQEGPTPGTSQAQTGQPGQEGASFGNVEGPRTVATQPQQQPTQPQNVVLAPPTTWGTQANTHMEYSMRTVEGRPNRNALHLSYTNQHARVHVQQDGGLLFPDLVQVAQGYQAMSLQSSIAHQGYPSQHFNPVAHSTAQPTLMSYAPPPNWIPAPQPGPYSAPLYPTWHQGSAHRFQSPPQQMLDMYNYGPYASTPISPGPAFPMYPYASPPNHGSTSSQPSFGEQSLQFGSPTSNLSSPVYSAEDLQNISGNYSWEHTPSNVEGLENSGTSSSSNQANVPNWGSRHPYN